MPYPYATLQRYYHSTTPPLFATAVFGGVGSQPCQTPNTATGPQCHVWRQSDSSGQVVMADAYPQCNLNSGCSRYVSKY